MTETEAREEVFRRLLSQYVDDVNAYGLQLFLPQFRADDEEVRIIPVKRAWQVLPEEFSFSSVESLQVYGGMQLESYGSIAWREYFMRGACALAPFIDSGAVELYRQLLGGTLERIAQHERYPALVDSYAGHYFEVGITLMLNEEPANRAQLMAYNYGVWWGLGHLNGVDEMTSNPHVPWGKAKTIPEWVEEVQVSRARQALMDSI